MLSERAGFVESVKVPDYPVDVLLDAVDVDVDSVDVDSYEPSFSDMEHFPLDTE